MVREAREDELGAMLALYLHLHEREIPQGKAVREAWRRIMADENHHLIVCEAEGRLVSSCVCVIVPNLTRGARPYALIENVVTAAGERGRGYATQCLNYARVLARSANCYKLMLMTGAKDERTLGFYEHAGYSRADKTAFVQWLEEGRQP